MTNSLTGDYDVVIELSFDTLNRILATLHAANREPHSMTIRVGGPSTPNLQIPGRVIPRPIPRLLRQERDRVSTISATTPGKVTPVTYFPPPEIVLPVGTVEVQVSTPTLSIPQPQDTPTKVNVQQWIMTYFIPDPNSTPMPEFTQGILQSTVNLALSSRPGARNITVPLTAQDIRVSFNPGWTSSPLDQQQKAWINQYITEFLETYIKPINVALPQALQKLGAVDAKFIRTPTDQVGAVLLGGIRQNAPLNPDPGSVTSDLLQGSGLPGPIDFAVAASSDLIAYLIQSNNQIKQTVPSSLTINFNWSINLWVTTISGTITYTLSVNPITVQLSPGQITLIITGHAQSDSSIGPISFPSTDFTIKQNVTLFVHDSNLLLSPLGNPSISLTGVLGDIEGLFNGQLVAAIGPIIDGALQQAQSSFQSTLNNQTQSITQSISSALNIGAVRVTYTNLSITSDGIIVVGLIALPSPPPVHVEFTQTNIPVSFELGPHGPVFASSQTQLNALGSWIPGGTITKYIWSLKSSPDDPHPHVITEQHQFVTTVSNQIPTEYVCLTVEGTQVMDFFGVVIGASVSGENCVSNAMSIAPIVPIPVGVRGLLPIAVATNTRERPPKPIVVGYLNPWSSSAVPEAAANNTIIHFVDPGTVEKDLSAFREILSAEKVAAFVVVVLPHEHVNKIGSIQLPANYFLGWADDHVGDWRGTFKVTKAPATVILGRSGAVVWHEHDPIPSTKLKTALKNNLLTGTILSTRQNASIRNVGRRAPDFIFEYSDGKRMALSNFYGRPIILMFWASWSQPSLEEVEYIQSNEKQFKEVVVLAVNDVDGREKAEETLKKYHVTFPLVMDPQGQIAKLYEVSCWPTIISINSKGIISNIYLGTTEKPSKTKAQAPPK